MKLKLCPFCGSQAETYMEHEYDHANQMEKDWLPKLTGVRCSQCHIPDTGIYHDAKDAFIIWNQRKS
jgi:hypothetical protein